MKILELGCGKMKGVGCPYKGDIVGVDIDPSSQADVIWNLEVVPYPFKNNEFDAVYSHDCVEHLDNTLNLMQELVRITKPHGRISTFIPNGASTFALNDLDHEQFFSVYAAVGITNSNPNLKILKAEYHYFPAGTTGWVGKLASDIIGWFINSHKYFYMKIGRFYIGDAEEIEWEFEVVK